MDILVKGNFIMEIEPNFSFGVFDGEEKWCAKDGDTEESNILYYIIDDGFTLFKDVTLPEDFTRGKYFFENGEFVLNEEWKEYVPPEERIRQLEETVAMQEEQLIATDETTIGLYEQIIAQEEINLVHDESIIELYELYGSLIQ